MNNNWKRDCYNSHEKKSELEIVWKPIPDSFVNISRRQFEWLKNTSILI